MGAEIAWGVGAKTGSASPKWSAVTQKALITLYTDGKLYLNVPSFSREEDDRHTFGVLHYSGSASFYHRVSRYQMYFSRPSS